MNRVELFRELAAQQLKDNKAHIKKFYDQCASNTKFVLGDEVWLSCPWLIGPECPKLCCHWHGPYYLCEQISKVLFKLRQSSDNKLLWTPVHVNRLKIVWARHLHRSKDTEIPKDQPTDDLTLKQMTSLMTVWARTLLNKVKRTALQYRKCQCWPHVRSNCPIVLRAPM